MVEGVGGADGSGGGDVDGVASIVEEGGANDVNRDVVNLKQTQTQTGKYNKFKTFKFHVMLFSFCWLSSHQIT